MLCAAPLFAQTTISAVSPLAVQPGTTTEVTLTGANLVDPLEVATSFPAKVERGPIEATQRKIKVSVSANVPVGIYGMIVGNFGGISPQFVMVDDLATVAEAANNNVLATPQDVTPPIAVDGASSGQQSDFYRVTLAQDQKLPIEVVGTRLGFDFDSVVRVLDTNGRELALADDDEGLGADARLVFSAPAAGQYLLELRDNRFKPGGRYRLRLGATSAVGFQPAMNDPAGGQPISEIEASAHAAAGQPIASPALVQGRLHEPKQKDRYAFAARKGERINFQALSRRFGSPAVIAMRVINAADAQLGATAPTEAEEELLAFTAPDDGTFRLEVEDLLGRGGPNYAYRIEVTAGPTFNLVCKNDANTRFTHLMQPGGAFIADIQVQRSGYDGPIQLGLRSPRSGFRLWPTVIPEKVNELRVYVYPPADFHPGELVDVRIGGKANVGPREHLTVARNLVQLRAARPFLPHPPQWLDSAFFVGYADQNAFYTVAPAAAELPVPIGGQAMVPFNFERLDANFKDVPLALAITSLPAGITVEVKRNGTGPKEAYEATFKAAANAPAGRHAVHWHAYVEFQGRGRVIEGDMTLVVNKP